MLCLHCQTPNKESARFCVQCGQSLATATPPAIACPQCATDCKPDTRFCPKCGYRLGQPAAAAAESQPAAPPTIELEIAPDVAPAPREPATETATSPVTVPRPASRTPLLILVAIALLAGIAAGAFFLMDWGSNQASAPSAADPRASMAQSVEILHPGPKNASGIIVPLAETASASSSASPPESLAASAMAEQPTPAPVRPTRTYSNAEIRRVLAEMKTNGPQPLDCTDAATILRDYYGATEAQAPAMARRGYPDLCSPKKTSTGTRAEAPRYAAPPATSSARYRSIDETYSTRAASECERGLAGVLCREHLKHTLCNGHWSANPPAGQSTCLFIENSSN